MTLTVKFNEALSYAADLHREQKRKGTDTPYVAHLMGVCALVLEHGGTEEQAIAALLHDAAEDQGGEVTLNEIRQRFGDGVAQIVADCTDSWVEPKPPWRERKEDYLEALPAKQTASLLVSLADKTHNAKAILTDYRQMGDDIWDRFVGGKDGTLWYYRALSDFFSASFPCPLAEELQKTVSAFTEAQDA